MNAGQLIVSSERVVTPTGIRPASVHVADGVIVAVDAPAPTGTEVVDVGSLVVMPGIVDSHVHVNDPGRADWEGFESAGRAAAAGGVTTFVDMPLNSTPATTSASALKAKVAAAQSRCRVDFGLWGGSFPETRVNSKRSSTRAPWPASASCPPRASTTFRM